MGRVSNQRRFDTNPRFTHVIFSLLILLLATFNIRAFAAEELVDGIAAEVNGQDILFSDIFSKLSRGQEIIVSEYPAGKDASDFERSLQDQINFELIMQKAEELEISVDDTELDNAIKKFIGDRNISFDMLKESLRREGIGFESYREDFRDQMVLREFQGRVIAPLVKITDREVENYYINKAGKSSESMTLKMRQIVFNLPPDADADTVTAKQKRAEAAYARLKGGVKFEDVLAQFSEDEDAKAKGGEMPPLKLGDLALALRSKIEPLAIGESTEPLRVGNHIFIFSLVERTLTGSSDFKAQQRQLENELRGQELGNQTLKWLTDQRKFSKIKIKSKDGKI